jgi:hypothetical protein
MTNPSQTQTFFFEGQKQKTKNDYGLANESKPTGMVVIGGKPTSKERKEFTHSNNPNSLFTNTLKQKYSSPF